MAHYQCPPQIWKNGLYLVSTPIGNLGDMSLRAIECLQQADMILCEDTRVTGQLCKYFNISTPLKRYDDHSSDEQRARIVETLKQGQKIALVSDAGTPMISDPGFKIARDCYEQDIDVFPLPGANAVLPALQLSGFASDQFTFAGFLPSKSGAKEAVLKEVVSKTETIIFYETAPRLLATLDIIDRLMPQRHVAVIREITKKFESAIRGSAQDVRSQFQENSNTLKGEIVLLIEGAEDQQDEGQVNVSYDVFLKEVLNVMSVKDAAKLLQALSGAPKKEIYDLALRLKEK